MRKLVAVPVLVVAMLANFAVRGQNASIDEALDSWARTKAVGISSAVRTDLKERARQAIEQVRRNRPQVSRAQLEQLAPTAVIAYLDKTQSSGRSVTISDLLEDLVVPGLIVEADAWGPINIYPILTIDVAPPEPLDFVIAIDGDSFRGEYRSFRVSPGSRNVRVTRQGRPPCVKVVNITPEGPNRILCSM